MMFSIEYGDWLTDQWWFWLIPIAIGVGVGLVIRRSAR